MPHPYSLKGLYAITDGSTGKSLFDKVEQAVAGGAAMIQYRDKSDDQARRLAEARTLQEILKPQDIPLIINDDIALARQSQAAGVHLGAEDGSLAAAREALGQQAIIGLSCYNRLELAVQGQQDGADYIALGSFFSSPTKPQAVNAELELLHQTTELQTPVCCIGGITVDNAEPLITAGADMLAVISSLFAAPDINAAARSFAQLFDK